MRISKPKIVKFKKAKKPSYYIYPPIDLLLEMKKGDTIGFGNEGYGGKKHWTIKRDR